MAVPGAAVAGPVFVTVRSALAAEVVLAVDVLLPVCGSEVVEEITAVFVIVVPLGVDDGTATTRSNVAVAAGANEASVHVTVAPPVQVNVGPLVWLIETNVVPVGTVSCSWTVAALEGPAFEAVIV